MIQFFINSNALTAGKACIGSPVKMATAENVELSAIDALKPDSFEIQVNESGQPCRVDAIKDNHIVGYVNVILMAIYDRLVYGQKYNDVDTIICDNDCRAKLIGREGDQWQAQIIDGEGQIIKFHAEDLANPPVYDPNGGFILQSFS